MTLTASGRLLIGTPTEATYMLDVNGTGRFSGNVTSLAASGAAVIVAEGSATNGEGVFQVKGKNSSGTIRTASFKYDNSDVIRIGTSSNIGMQFETNDVSRFSIASTGAATFTGSITSTNSTGSISMVAAGSSDTKNSSGSFNIYDTTNNRGWGLQQDASYKLNFWHYNGGWASVANISGTGAATFSSSVTATGFFESSDSRLKTLIQDNYQTKGIASITPKLYTKNGKVELGYYAQDFVGILDSAVSKGSDDMLSLSYREVLVAKVYALEQEIKELKAKMN
jgi:hypothetical protein